MVLVAAAAVATFALSVVGPLLSDDWSFDFVYDDHRFVERNEEIRSLDLWRFLKDPRTVDPDEMNWKGIYRPLRTFSFAVDHVFWGVRPVGYHLQNLAWHALAAVALLLLMVRLGVGRVPAVLATLVFAVHPVQAESVVWITSRGDVMSGALVLLALAVHAGARRSSLARGLAVAGIGLVAMLAKEVAVCLPAALVILDVLVRRPWTDDAGPGRTRSAVVRHAIAGWLPSAVVALGYVVLRQSVMAAYDDTGGHLRAWWGGSWGSQLVVSARGFLLHVASVLFPVGRRLDYYPPTHGALDSGALTGLFVLLAMLAVAALAWRRRPPVAAGILLFLLFLFPTSSVLVTVGIPSADRFLYLSLAGAALALTPLARRPAPVGAAVVLLVAIAVPHTTKFADDDRLWATAADGSPRALVDEGRRRYDVVAEHWEEGRLEMARALTPRAMAACKAALARWKEIRPTEGITPLFYTHVRISDLYRLDGDRAESYAALKRAQSVRPDHPKVPYQRSWLLRDLGDDAGAIRNLLLARELGFRDDLREELARTLNDLARREIEEGSFGWAIVYLGRSLQEWPRTAGNDAEKLLAPLEEEKGRRLAEPEPARDDLQGWLERGRMLGQFGERERAGRILEALLQSLRRDPVVMVTLARWVYEQEREGPRARGHGVRAVDLYARAASIDPANEEALMGLVRCDGFRLDPLLRASPERRVQMLERLPQDDPRVLVLLARAHREIGRHVTARTLLEKASMGQGPGVIDALDDLWEEDHGDR
jgi:tetratricopeptide (TPR) repeat protein